MSQSIHTLQHLHHVTRHDPLAEQLTTAYDAYLEIIRQVDARVHGAMGRDMGWYIRNVYAPCLYKVNNEAPFKFSLLRCMDGNNSLKLVDTTFCTRSVRCDDHLLTSFRWLTSQVNVFKDEDSCKPLSNDPTASSDPPTLPPTPDVDNPETFQDSDELTKCLNTCVERWKAVGPEARKKMFALFAVAGIFLTVCRYGHILIMCDMIRSGELMKYLLAMVKWLLDQYSADIGLGYDIMCTFFKTLKHSSMGARVTAMCLQGVVPAFYGHTYNRACQIGWHPLYVEGVDMEDFEECEHTFSKSNHLASTTRLATAFHRQQQIDEHFQFYNQDKHTVSGNFTYQNYRQALEKITTNAGQLSALEQHLGTTSTDYERGSRHGGRILPELTF
ncbi:hypothetical protein B0H14DRAFT_2402739 [Mycena olivaceomarginata]|nr:hypothetical protein B0H14DRAFT_2402739 [Mycena olivaceomarginata]